MLFNSVHLTELFCVRDTYDKPARHLCLKYITKTRPCAIQRFFLFRYTEISQVIISFWSFEISEDILRNQKFIIS